LNSASSTTSTGESLELRSSIVVRGKLLPCSASSAVCTSILPTVTGSTSAAPGGSAPIHAEASKTSTLAPRKSAESTGTSNG